VGLTRQTYCLKIIWAVGMCGSMSLGWRRKEISAPEKYKAEKTTLNVEIDFQI
jgi:hypothetical protein